MKLAKISKNISAALSAVCVLALIFTVGAVTVVNNIEQLLFPDGTDQTPGVKERITAAFNDNLAGFDSFLNIYGMAQRAAGATVFEDAGYTYVIKDGSGALHFHTVRQDAAPYAASVAELRNTLLENDIPFLYIQAPTKEMDSHTVYPPGISYASAENAEDMLDALHGLGVETISLSRVLSESGIPAEKQFYRTDHHWTTESAFAAFVHTVDYLNSELGMDVDTSVCDELRWNRITMRSAFLGSAGRRIGQALAGLDDYTFIEPAFETSYNVYYPKISSEWPNWAGNFRTALVRDGLLFSDDVSANRYASYFEYDYGELIIDNLLAENDLHITVIKDSFALPYSAFLSTAVKRIDMIDLREFEGSVTEHILNTSPDIVIILYSNSSFKDIMYDFTDSLDESA